MHRYNEKDVRAAFVTYVNVTGDHQASLEISHPGDSYGTRYQVINAGTSIGRSSGPVWCGAAQAWTAIHEYTNGYRDAVISDISELLGKTASPESIADFFKGVTDEARTTRETARPIR